MRTNSLVGTYAYANAGKAEHAPSSVTPASGPAQALAYDLNGNQTTGLDGKVMTYDGENRPVSVSYAGKTTTYVYGADGARLKKVESEPVAGSSVTLYLGAAEIRKYGQGAAEEILLYPQPNIRITKTKSGSTVTTKVNTLHADGLGSVRAVTDATGAVVERTTYRPFGEEVRLSQPLTLAETKGFIGERFDDGAGLQYLNARYYDPRLGMFTQPDWWEVMQEGVGTNRYSYSFDDPVNGRDPGGHESWDLTRDQEDSDRANEEAARDAQQRADRIRAGNSFLDRLRDKFGVDDYWEGRAENHKSRIGKSWGNRAFGDAITAVEVGSIMAGGAALTQGAKGLVKKAAEKTLAKTTLNEAVATSAEVSLNKLNHIFGKKSHKLEELLDKFGGDPKAAFEAVQRAANQSLAKGTLQTTGTNGVLSSAGPVLEVNGSLVQLSGGRIVGNSVQIGSFSGVIRVSP